MNKAILILFLVLRTCFAQDDIKLVLPVGHSYMVDNVVLTGSEKRIISNGYDGKIKIWDISSGKLLQTLIGHESTRINGFQLIKNEKILVSYSYDKTIKIWDVNSGRIIHNITGHETRIKGVIITADEKRIISYGKDGLIKIWNIESGKLTRTLPFLDNINEILLTQEEDRIIYYGDSTIIIWDTESNDILHVLKGHKRMINGARLIEKESRLITYDSDGRIKLWNLDNGRLIHDIEAHEYRVTRIRLSKDETTLFSCSDEDSIIKSWNLNSGKMIHSFFDHDGSVYDIIITNNEDKMISYGPSHDDTIIRIWDIEKGTLLHKLSGHTSSIKGIYLNSNNENLVSFSQDNTIKVWDVNDGTLSHDFHHNSRIDRVFLNKFDDRMVSNSQDNIIRIWDIKTGIEIDSLTLHTNFIRGILITDDEKKLISYGDDGTIKIWNMESLKLVQDIRGSSLQIDGLKLNNDKSNIFSFHNDGAIKIWDIKRGSLLYNLKNRFTVRDIKLNQDLDHILAHGFNIINIWSSKDGRLLKNIESSHEIGFLIFIDEKQTKFITFHLRSNIIKVWDLINGDSFELTCSDNLREVRLINDHELISYTYAGTLGVWNIKSRIFKEISINESLASFNVYKKSGRLVTYDDDCLIRVYDLENYKLLYIIEDHKSNISDGYGLYRGLSVLRLLTDDGKLIISSDSIIHVRNIKNGNLIFKLNGHNNVVHRMFLNRNQDRLFSIADDRVIKIWNLANGKLMKELKGHTSWVKGSLLNKDESILITYSENGLIKVWDVKSGHLIYDLKEHTGEVLKVLLNKDEDKIISYSTDNLIKEWDLITGQLTASLIGHTSYIQKVTPIEGRKLVSYGIDNTIKIWDLDKNKLLYTILYLRNSNWIIMLEDSKYYYCSKDASKMLHYVTDDLKVIGFDQLDPVYNRPDIVLDSLNNFFGSLDEDLIHQYNNAWVKRMEYLGMDTSVIADGSIQIPYAEIINEESISYQQDHSELTLNLSASDSVNTLLRYNILINEVPLYGSTGFSLKNRSISQFDTTITISLTEGVNRIQFSVFNDKNFENYKYPLYVNYKTKDKLVSNTYFIGIGVDEFIDPDIIDLSYCVQDINDINSALSNKDDIISHLYLNKEVTRDNILGIKDILLNTTVNDKVVISCSSHGLLDSVNNFYLAMHDVNSEDPVQGGLKYEELIGLLDSIPARKKLLLIDACNSGNNEITENNQVIISDSNLGGGRGDLIIEDVNEENILHSSFDKMMELFVNINNPTGAIVISASGGKQSALEGDAVTIDGKQIENGAFTHCFLEFLNNNSIITISDLKSYIQDRVEVITNGKQKPTSKQEVLEYDWELY